MNECVFCNLITNRAIPFVREWDDAVAFVPLDPVTEGHVLIVPKEHVRDFTESERVSAAMMRRACDYAFGECDHANIITSAGSEATQSVFHLHLHYVPRRKGDGLHLPWTGQ